MSHLSLSDEEKRLVLVGDGAYRLDLWNKMTKMTINAEEGVEDIAEDVGRTRSLRNCTREENRARRGAD